MTTTLYCDLVETQTYLDKLRAEKPRVSAHLDDWVDHRRLTIRTIDQLREDIDNVYVGCNVAKGVGAAAGIGSVVTGLLGLFSEVNEDPETAESFYTASKYCAGASLVTLATTTLLEIGLTQSALDEIKRVIQKDIELTKPLKNWIQISQGIDCRVNRLFKCNLASDTFSTVLKVCWQCIKLLESGSVLIQDLIHRLSHLKMEGFVDLTVEISDKVINFLKNPELRQPFVEIWNIISDDPYILELAKVGVTIYSKTIDLLKTEANVIALLLSSEGIRLPIVSLSSCALNVISLASNVVTLILAVKNIKEGKSKYSESLDRVKWVLSTELREVNKQVPLTLKSDYENNLEFGFAKMAILSNALKK